MNPKHRSRAVIRKRKQKQLSELEAAAFTARFFDKKPDKRGRPPAYRLDVLRERLDALTKELSRRYEKVGTWPESGTKWAKGTEIYIRKWWRHGLDELAEWARLPERPYPAKEIEIRLSSREKGIGGLMEMVYFLLSARLGRSPASIQNFLRNK